MKTIIIAGATSMIGRACVNLFNSPDYSLVLIGRNLQKLESLTKDLTAQHEIHTIDFSSTETIQSTVKDIVSKHPTIDTLIYNTAIYPWNQIENILSNDWQQTISINLNSAFYLTQALIPILKKQKSGNIIYVSSIAAESMGLANMSAYTSSKAGLNGLMRTCALELAPYNINVNSISPGKIYDTTRLSKKEISEKLSNVPLKRFIKPKNIAEMIKFLISDCGKDITGQNLIIDGGQTIV
ncbi:MAG: NAD-dependent glycerol dehydrogenase [Chlamydiia bacterium]|nr:NAD-dependent glycerol dehydrogenase [Chlamydiia bacterium]